MTAKKTSNLTLFQLWGLAFLAFIAVLYILRTMLTPFVAGLALAYFLDPVADQLEKRGVKRGPAVLIITLVFMICGIALLATILPIIQQQVVSLVKNVPRYVDSGWLVLAPYIEQVRAYLPAEHFASLEDAVSQYIGRIVNNVGAFVTGLLSRGVALFNLLSLLVVTPVVAIYLLRDWDYMVTKVDSWLPRDNANAIRAIARDIDKTLAGFIRGQATVCLALACVYGTGLSLVGLEAGLLLGIASGMAAFVPYVGGITGFTVAIILALFQFADWQPIAGVVAVFAVGQVLEGYVLTPRLVGNRIGLHPVWVMFALLAGGALFGFAGVLVALPVASVIGVLVRHGLRRYLASSAYSGREVSQEDV